MIKLTFSSSIKEGTKFKKKTTTCQPVMWGHTGTYCFRCSRSFPRWLYSCSQTLPSQESCKTLVSYNMMRDGLLLLQELMNYLLTTKWRCLLKIIEGKKKKLSPSGTTSLCVYWDNRMHRCKRITPTEPQHYWNDPINNSKNPVHLTLLLVSHSSSTSLS